MQFEVEQKHRVPDVRALDERLAERGAEIGPPVEQSDQYFAHPCRDFAKTDEALRIRTVGDKSFVTYKGPKLDTTTKTRRELELPLDPSDADGSKFAELLRSLGFTPVAVVRKRRRTFRHRCRTADEVEGALDDVDGVGTFVELELHGRRVRPRRGEARHLHTGDRARSGPIRAPQLSGNDARKASPSSLRN